MRPGRWMPGGVLESLPVTNARPSTFAAECPAISQRTGGVVGVSSATTSVSLRPWVNVPKSRLVRFCVGDRALGDIQ